MYNHNDFRDCRELLEQR